MQSFGSVVDLHPVDGFIVAEVMRLMTDSGIVQSTPGQLSRDTSQKHAIFCLGGRRRIQMSRQVESGMQDMFNKSSIPDIYKQMTTRTL